MARSRIGFLTSGSGGNPTGIGDYVAQLTQASIPAVVACNDGDVGIGDALNTNVDHVLLFRVVVDGTEAWSVPDYSLPPIQAAQKHWDKIKSKFNPNIVAHKDRVWVQPINEVDKNRSDWLGYFGVEIAEIAKSEGFKVALFAFSSGEPEPTDWRTPGMIAYLNYCQNNPEQACIALHEYDYGQQGMANVYPYHIGRFQELYRACDDLQIAYPKIIISEFGWSYNSIPEQNKAMNDIAFAAELYARYDEVLGATIWYLGPGFSNIANEVQKLIEPVTTYTLNTEFPDPEEPPMPECKGLPREPYTRRYNVIPSNATEQQAVAIFLEGWRRTRETTGGSYDDAGIGDLPTKVANLYGIPDDQKQVFINWYNQHYPGTLISFLPMPGEESPFEFAVYPVKGRTLQVNSYFNAPRTYGLHEGIDLFAQNSDEIVAVESGIVDGIRTVDPGTGYGIYVRVKHSERFFTWYTHLKSVSVFVGEVVAAGQVVGLADSTGNSTGDHLHLTLVDLVEGLDGYVVPKVVDPLPYLQKFSTSPTYQYNGPAVTFSPALHGPASDYEWQNPELKSMLNTLNMPVKFMSNGINADYYTQYKRPALDLVRVFWQPHIYKTPQQAWNDDIRDGVLRFYNLGARDFEILNEPNLPGEGAYLVWDENDFGDWLRGLCLIIKSNCPGARLWFPGMSPGSPWTNQFGWTNKAWPKVKDLCYGFCLHSYTGITDNATNAINDIVNQVKESQSYLNLQVPLIVSESSVNRAATPAYKAQVYKGVENQLKSVAGIKGVVWYVSSWEQVPPEQDNHQEDWLKWGIWQPYSQQ